MIIWHGSKNIIEKPVWGQGSPYNDYGLGFYCTEHVELAKEWACTEENDGFANKYDISTRGLNIVELSGTDFTVLNWLALLAKNREFTPTTAIAKDALQYLKANFLPDISGADIIIGYRADDSYFTFAKSFVSNQITVSQLAKAMMLGKLGLQVVIKSQKAFDKLNFLGYEISKRDDYYIKKKARDDKARSDYQTIANQIDTKGIYMIDIIREGIKNDDPRIF